MTATPQKSDWIALVRAAFETPSKPIPEEKLAAMAAIAEGFFHGYVCGLNAGAAELARANDLIQALFAAKR